MKINYFKTVLTLSILVVTFIACDNDDTPTPEAAKGEIVIGSSLVNPDGQSGSSFMQLIDDLSPETYANTTALPLDFTAQVSLIGENLYELPFFGIDAVTKYTRSSDGVLSKVGQLPLNGNSSPTGMVLKSATEAYIALAGKGKILIVDPTTMTKKGEIDLSAYAVGDSNPDPGQMVIRGNKLYVALNQMVGGFFPAPTRNKSDVVIINTDTNEVEKMITEESSGMSQPTRPIDAKQMFVDENNDIYIFCIGGFGFIPGHKAGILRIKNGETEFDDTYNYVLSDAIIGGESNKMDWVQWVQYTGNGKLYAQVNISAYFSSPPNFVTDRTVICVEIDLYNKSVKKLDFPRGNSYGSVGLYKDKIVFGLATDSENGFFLMI